MTSDEKREHERERNMIEAERRVEEAALGGVSGSGSGDDSGATGSEWTPEDAEEYAAWSDGVNAAQAERMRWEREVDAIYATEEVERMQREADERRNDQ